MGKYSLKLEIFRCWDPFLGTSVGYVITQVVTGLARLLRVQRPIPSSAAPRPVKVCTATCMQGCTKCKCGHQGPYLGVMLDSSSRAGLAASAANFCRGAPHLAYGHFQRNLLRIKCVLTMMQPQAASYS